MRLVLVLATATSALCMVLTGCAASPEDPTAGFVSLRKPASVGIDCAIRDLLNNPATLAVLQKDMPGMVDDPQFGMVRLMTLRQLAQFPQAGLNEAKLRLVKADLEATAQAPRTPESSAQAAAAGESKTDAAAAR